MKKSLKISGTFLMMGMMLASCDNAEYSPLSPHAYLAEAANSSGTKITVSETTTTTKLNVRLSDKVNQDCQFELVTDQDALDRYNKANGTNYIMLPKEGYSMPDKITIKAGQYAADPIEISIYPFSDEMATSGEQYALPLRLKAVSGGIEAMNQSGCYVIATGNVLKFSSPVLSAYTTVSVNMPYELVLNEYTIEMRFQVSGFYENQAFFSGSGDGAKDETYIRLEDPINICNLMQIKLKGTYLNAITPNEKNKWQHFAITFSNSQVKIYINGKLDAQKEVGGDPVTLKKISLICSNFRANCLLNEVRLWSKALNETQIQNNMTVVSPTSAGLEAYWKMNEGEGNFFKDATGHGFDGQAKGTVRWIHNILSTDESTPWN